MKKSINQYVLTKTILIDPAIRGLSLGSTAIKLQQYANDTTMIFTDRAEIKAAMKILNDFSKHSNLKINAKKTTAISNNQLLTDQTKRHYPDANLNEAVPRSFLFTNKFYKKKRTGPG